MSTVRSPTIAAETYADIKSVCPLAKPEDFFPNGKILSEEVINQLHATLANETETTRFSKKYLKETYNIDIQRGGIIRLTDLTTGKPSLFATYKNQLNQSQQNNSNKTHQSFVLGQGGFGKVKLVQNLDTGDWMAIKVIKIEKSLSENDKAAAKNSIEWEAYFLEKLKQGSRRVFSKKGAPSEALSNTPDKTYMMVKLKRGKNLYRTLGKSYFSYAERIDIAIKLLTELQKIHDEGILHRDIKLENIMYDPATKSASIIDFGLASTVNSPYHSLCGTALYIAPEIWRAQFPNREVNQKAAVVDPTNVYSAASDLFAMGRVFQDLFGITDNSPMFIDFDQTEMSNTFGFHDKNLDVNDFPKQTYKEIRNLVKKMLLNNPSQRPTLDSLMREFEKINAELLQNLIHDELSASERFTLISQIFNIVKKMHDNEIIHRDITLEKFFYDTSTKTVTLLNNHHTTQIDDTQRQYETVGTKGYISPELKKAQENHPQQYAELKTLKEKLNSDGHAPLNPEEEEKIYPPLPYSKATDVYALGTLVKETFALDSDKSYIKIPGLSYAQRHQLTLLTEQMTNADPALRIDLTQAEAQLRDILAQSEALQQQLTTVNNHYALKDIIDDTTNTPRSSFVEIALKLSTILRELHEQGMVHRDINATNIFFDPITNTVTLLNTNTTIRHGTLDKPFAGPSLYMAPEIKEAIDKNEHITYQTSADIYSFGILLNQLFENDDEDNLSETETDFFALIAAMCKTDPTMRPYIQEIQQKLQTLSKKLFSEPQQHPEDAIKNSAINLSQNRSSFFSTSLRIPSPTRSLKGSEPNSPNALDFGRNSPAPLTHNRLLTTKNEIKHCIQELRNTLDEAQIDSNLKKIIQPIYENTDKLIFTDNNIEDAEFIKEYVNFTKSVSKAVDDNWALSQVLNTTMDTIISHIEIVLDENPPLIKENKLDRLNSLITQLEVELASENIKTLSLGR